jgi:hypothetical protein
MNATSHPTSERTLVHTRQITCDAYVRSDGLYEIEGRMVDQKTFEAVLPFKTVAPRVPFHDMRITMAVDSDMVIRHVEARTAAAPTPYCTEMNATYASLVGVSIGPGFKAEVKARVGGAKGCTHLTDLLGPMATTVIQASLAQMQTAERVRMLTDSELPMPKPWVIGTCHTYRMDGEAVKVIWPEGRRMTVQDRPKAEGTGD